MIGTGLGRFLWVAQQRVPAIEKAVLLTLADHADKDTLECFPHQETLAEEAGCSRRTVQRALEKLRERGLIDWRRGKDRLYFRLLITLVEDDASEPVMRHSDATDAPERRFVRRHSDAQNRVIEQGHGTGGSDTPPRTPSKKGSRTRKRSPSPPTEKQLAYITSLAKERDVPVPSVDTYMAASAAIDELKEQAPLSQGQKSLRKLEDMLKWGTKDDPFNIEDDPIDKAKDVTEGEEG